MRLIAILVLTGCVVTRPPNLAERPRWKIGNGETFSGVCADARGIVRKSGKQGFGVALQLRSHGDCTFAIRRAALVFPARRSIAVAPPAPIVLAGRSQITVWLPVAFDNNRAWNDGENDATLELLTSEGIWRLMLHQGAP